MAYKHYSDNERTEALIRLATNKYDYELTSEQLDISDRTLRRWDKVAIKKGVPELLDRAIERMLMVIPDKWAGNEWAIALGILIDKWLLMQGEPTQRTENLLRGYSELTDEERKLIGERVRSFLNIGSDGNILGDGGIRSDNGDGPS